MSINAIVAVDNNMGIGYENSLPWPYNKKDMKWFSKCTTGHVVVMGRGTWESLGSKPLPNRINVVISNNEVKGNPERTERGDIVDIIATLATKYSHLDIFIIGGADILQQALPYCNKLYITKIKKSYRCDTFIHNQDLEDFSRLEYLDEDDSISIQIRSKK